jgi:hypothetical protein
VKLRLELPAMEVAAEVALLADAAPRVSRAIYEALAIPLETHTAHACFDGHEVFCFLPAFPEAPPIENRTMRPLPGDVMFFYAGPNEYACMAEDRLSGGSGAVHELAFMYGDVDLRHFWEEGVHGSLVGHVATGFNGFAAACRRTLDEGRTPLRLSQAP